MHRFLAVPILALSLGCEVPESSHSFPDLKAEDVAGHWTFTVSDQESHCTRGSSGGQFGVTLTGSSAEVQDHSLEFSSATWDRGQVSGYVDLSGGYLDLRVWVGIGIRGARLVGNVHRGSPLTFTGRLFDPIPGYATVFMLGPCIFPMDGVHD